MFDVRRADSGDAARRIHIDGRRIDDLADRIVMEITRGVDPVIVSRFGPLELAGRDFCQVIRHASLTGVPLVIAVPRSAFGDWTRFSGGMAVRLDCRLERLLARWRGLETTDESAGRPSTCEFFK